MVDGQPATSSGQSCLDLVSDKQDLMGDSTTAVVTNPAPTGNGGLYLTPPIPAREHDVCHPLSLANVVSAPVSALPR